MNRLRLRTFVGALAALLAQAAHAHPAGLSYGTWTAAGDEVRAEVRLRAEELRPASADPSPSTDPASLARAFLGGVEVSREGAACTGSPGPARTIPPDGLELTATFRCPAASGPMEVRLPILTRLPPGHVHLARVEANGNAEERVADARQPRFELAADPAPLRRASSFVVLGVEHILTGWDHLAFLLALLLASVRLGDVLRSLTAFTAAHAVTLSLGVLGVVSPPGEIVEPIIAASVVWVAAVNLFDLRRGRLSGRPRWPLAFAFGLVHGFGFAGALGELRLGGGDVTLALGSFNAGIELGQAAVAMLVFPVLRWLRSSPRAAVPGLSAGSAAVAAAGLFWLAERLPW